MNYTRIVLVLVLGISSISAMPDFFCKFVIPCIARDIITQCLDQDSSGESLNLEDIKQQLKKYGEPADIQKKFEEGEEPASDLYMVRSLLDKKNLGSPLEEPFEFEDKSLEEFGYETPDDPYDTFLTFLVVAMTKHVAASKELELPENIKQQCDTTTPRYFQDLKNLHIPMKAIQSMEDIYQKAHTAPNTKTVEQRYEDIFQNHLRDQQKFDEAKLCEDYYAVRSDLDENSSWLPQGIPFRKWAIAAAPRKAIKKANNFIEENGLANFRPGTPPGDIADSGISPECTTFIKLLAALQTARKERAFYGMMLCDQKEVFIEKFNCGFVFDNDSQPTIEIVRKAREWDSDYLHSLFTFMSDLEFKYLFNSLDTNWQRYIRDEFSEEIPPRWLSDNFLTKPLPVYVSAEDALNIEIPSFSDCEGSSSEDSDS